MALRIVFAGTPEFAVPCLRAAAARGEVVAVFSQPDRPAGRGRQVHMSPVKREALARNLPVLQPETFKSGPACDDLRRLRPDLMIVVAYGLILPQKVLDVPANGCWNVHASLLPRWRGAAPIQRAIEAGDHASGVCLMRMERGLDTGPVMLALSTPISADDTGGSLHDRLSVLGAQLIDDVLKLLRAGIRPVAQAQANVGITYARKLEKTEARLDWALPAQTLADKVRAFHPWPVCEAQVAGERLRVHAATFVPLRHELAAGNVLAAGKAGLDIACGVGALRLLKVQRDGGRIVDIADYLNARPNLRPT